GEEPLALAVDAANDVIFSYGVDIDLVGTIAKLSGADGSVLWTHGPQAPGIAAIAVGAAGDGITADGRGTQVAQRSGADGSIVWTQPAAGGLRLAFDSSGDIVAVGRTGDPFGAMARVSKLSALTGAVLWEFIDGSFDGYFDAVTFDAAGHIVVAGAPTELLGFYVYPSM